MKLIRPTDITDALLVSSDVPEAAPTAWSSATTYSVGDRASVVNGALIDVYESIHPGNRILYSEQFDNAVWNTSAAVTITPDATLAPDGTSTADKIAETSSNTLHAVGQIYSATNVTMTFSCYLKAGERTKAYLELSNTLNASCYVIFDLAAGTIVSTTASNADFSNISGTISSVGNGWYRCTITATKGSVNGTFAPYVHITDNAGNYSYAGTTGYGIYAWGAQFEIGSSAHAYVLTTNAAALNVNRAPATSPLWWLKAASVYPAYSSGTTYAANAIVQDNTAHRVYQSVQASNTGHPLTDPLWWTDIGPTNRWAMFDQRVGTLSTATGTMTVVLQPGSIDSLAVVDCDAELVTVSVTVSSTVVYTKTLSTNVGGAAINSWFTWFFELIGKRTVLTWLDVPPFTNGIVTIQFQGANPAGPVNCGTLLVGRKLDLGKTEDQAKPTFADFSQKTQDAFGAWSITPRAWSKQMSVNTMLPTEQVDAVYREVVKVRAKACLWIGEDTFDSLIIYGFVKDFAPVLSFSDQSYCSLTVEGLT